MTGAAKRTAGAVAVISVAMALVLTVVVGGLWLLLRQLPQSHNAPVVPADHCLAVASHYRGSLMPEQAENAAIIVAESIRRGLPARAATIALATALQESGLLNLDYGDRDSLGLFQQRPSQGWGTKAQVMDPWYASGKFYAALVKVKNWQSRDIGEVAQAVQRSAYPDAYDQYEGAGRAWASTLTGQTTAGLTCVTAQWSGGGGDDLVALLTRTWGQKLTVEQTDATITVTAPSTATAWAIAQLAMAKLAVNGLAAVQVGDQTWTASQTALAPWLKSGQPAASSRQVTLTLA